jgi:hypothetical protein
MINRSTGQIRGASPTGAAHHLLVQKRIDAKLAIRKHHDL